MDPIPETAEAIEEYGPFTAVGEDDVLAHLRSVAARVRLVVPECVGMSVAMRQHGVTLTLVSTDQEIAALDGVQYLSDGPCVSAVDEDRVVEYRATDVLDESSWQLFAQVTAAAGIASTLTLPIMDGDEVVGSVNLYASEPTAFSGHHEAIGAIVGAWAPGAVSNADLTFATRRVAEQAPQILRDDMRIQIAVGIIIASEGVDAETARARLRLAAEHAGISQSTLAKKIISRITRTDDLNDPDDPQTPEWGGDAADEDH